MPELTEAQWKKAADHLELDGLYFLYGEEKYLIAAYLKRLLKKASEQPFADFNVQRFSGDGLLADKVADAAEALPMMAEKKYVVITDLDVEKLPARELSKLYELVENLPETTVLLVFQPTLEMDVKKSAAWKKWLTAVKKQGTVVEVRPREGAELERLLCAYAEKRGCELSRQDAAFLISQCGKELQTLFHELDKLCAYIGKGAVTRAAIDRVAVKNLETTVFLLSKALVSAQYDKAYSLLDLLYQQREEPVAVLAVLSSAYVDLYRVRACVQGGHSPAELANYFPYKGKEFRLKNAERDMKGLSLEKLRESLEVLLETDIGLKSSRTGDRILMEKLIARLLLIAEKERIT